MRGAKIDRPFALLVAVLVIGGSLVFASAVFGLLARGSSNMSSVVFNHAFLGIGVGLVALVIASRIPYQIWKRFAPHLFILALMLTAAVFLPQIGLEHGGGRRWLNLAGFSLQPSEFLKVASIIMAAAYFSTIRARVQTLQWGLGGLVLILLGPVVILIAQPDLGTLGIIVISVMAIFFASGARFRDLLVLMVLAALAVALLASFRPYVLDRIEVFFNPSLSPHDEGYQIRQSLMAIGSGGLLGRGFGQSIQKFTYLPEPMGDSIFAVLGEEFGFVGALFLIGIFLSLALRGFWIAIHTTDLFGAYLATGISTYLVVEAFINIASMLGLAPLTGIPLTFISQGGSAMLASLGSAGILLGVSRRRGHS